MHWMLVWKIWSLFGDAMRCIFLAQSSGAEHPVWGPENGTSNQLRSWNILRISIGTLCMENWCNTKLQQHEHSTIEHSQHGCHMNHIRLCCSTKVTCFNMEPSNCWNIISYWDLPQSFPTTQWPDTLTTFFGLLKLLSLACRVALIVLAWAADSWTALMSRSLIPHRPWEGWPQHLLRVRPCSTSSYRSNKETSTLYTVLGIDWCCYAFGLGMFCHLPDMDWKGNACFQFWYIRPSLCTCFFRTYQITLIRVLRCLFVKHLIVGSS